MEEQAAVAALTLALSPGLGPESDSQQLPAPTPPSYLQLLPHPLPCPLQSNAVHLWALARVWGLLNTEHTETPSRSWPISSADPAALPAEAVSSIQNCSMARQGLSFHKLCSRTEQLYKCLRVRGGGEEAETGQFGENGGEADGGVGGGGVGGSEAGKLKGEEVDGTEGKGAT